MTPCNEDGNYKGQCCCNCIYQCKITKHPWNKQEILKGSCSEHVAYGCTAFHVLHQVNKVKGVQEEGSIGNVVAFEDKHNMCEMWEEKK